MPERANSVMVCAECDTPIEVTEIDYGTGEKRRIPCRHDDAGFIIKPFLWPVA